MSIALSQSDLHALEDQVVHAVRTGDESCLRIIGYGEITTVLLLETNDGTFAVKRLPVMKSLADAEHVAHTIDAYVEALSARGIHVVPNEARILERDNGDFIVYCVQTALSEESLATNWFRDHDPDECQAQFERIVDRIEGGISPEVTSDGQLSNWAFVGDDLLYLDVSTPFYRDADGVSLLDWSNYMGPIPAPIRWYYMREVPKVLDHYFDLRGQLLDFLGNLRKEQLDHLTPGFTDYVNERFDFEKPITATDIQQFYTEDAKMYALVERLRKFDRWVHRNILRRTYPYLLAPNIERNLY
jgi:hypothetical protein